MTKSKYSRRTFIHQYLSTGSIFFAAIVVGSCKNKGEGEDKKEVSTTACKDLSGVDKSELEKREKLAYVDKSPVSESYCGNCSMYVPGGKGKDCGTCMLFKGTVYASGYCIQYVAKV